MKIATKKFVFDFTHILKLGEDKEKLWANYKSNVKNRIRKAIKLGVFCKESNNNINEWKKYYSIYQEALKRWEWEKNSLHLKLDLG